MPVTTTPAASDSPSQGPVAPLLMAKTKTRPTRLIATLAEIRAEPGQFMDQVVWVPTDDLLAAHHPENPRSHEEDPPGIFKSLLWMGWGEYGISFNPLTGRLTGGHGRSMAADIGRKQDLDTFEKQWERWLKEDPDRKEIAEVVNTRFQSSYWEHCPVVVCTLSEIDQKTLMLRLNDSQRDGKDDPARMAAVLAQIPKHQVELTGWDNSSAEAFKSAFMIKSREPDPEPESDGYEFDSGMPDEGGTEYEGKERFERPDATDYSGPDWGDTDAEAESGPVRVATGDGGWAEVATETEDIEDTGAGVFKHSGGFYSETRTILYVSQKQNEDWKVYCKAIADGLGIDRVSETAKVWRTQATFGALEWLIKNHPDISAAYQALLAAQVELDTPEESDADTESAAD